MNPCQYFTPEWAAVELVEQYFQELDSKDLVLEPSCGLGAFLKAIPENVPAVGVEIDPAVAARARENTGREILVGDFCLRELPQGVTAMVGNPPFHVPTIDRFIQRASNILPEGGKCGLILPAYAMQTHQTVMRWHKNFSISADVIPRRLFPRLRLPLLFCMFTREQQRTMVGFALYRQAVEIDNLRTEARKILENGKPNRGVWRALVEETLRGLGGEADLQSMYGVIESRRPTENVWWKEKVRQVLQIHFRNVAPGRWSLLEGL